MCQVGSQIQEVTKDASESSWPIRLILKQIDYLGSIYINNFYLLSLKSDKTLIAWW